MISHSQKIGPAGIAIGSVVGFFSPLFLQSISPETKTVTKGPSPLHRRITEVGGASSKLHLPKYDDKHCIDLLVHPDVSLEGLRKGLLETALIIPERSAEDVSFYSG